MFSPWFLCRNCLRLMKGTCNHLLSTRGMAPREHPPPTVANLHHQPTAHYAPRLTAQTRISVKLKFFRRLKILYTVYKTPISVKKNVKTLILYSATKRSPCSLRFYFICGSTAHFRCSRKLTLRVQTVRLLDASFRLEPQRFGESHCLRSPFNCRFWFIMGASARGVS